MESEHYLNPYAGQTFWGFFIQLFIRLWLFLQGKLGLKDVASDEVQILVLIGVSASAALVGTFLVLRKMTMLANSLSHTILIGIVMAFLWTGQALSSDSHLHHIGEINALAMLIAALCVGLMTSFFTELLTKKARLQEDASIGLVFTSLFVIGVIALTVLMRDAHIGTEVVMGNVDALQLSDCQLVYIVLGLNIAIFGLFFKEFKITTFDCGLSRAFGISPAFFNYLLMASVSATSIAAFRAVGVLMVLTFITGPVLTARLLVDDLKKMIALAISVGALASLMGVAFARHALTEYGISLSTAGVVVCFIVVIYGLAICYKLRRLD